MRLVLPVTALLVAALAATGPAEAPAAGERCPVTVPNRRDLDRVLPSGTQNGNGKLSTVLYHPVLRVTRRNRQPDGSIAEKFPWWRAVRGELRISGLRLDGPARPLRALVPEGYGESGLQASAIVFPTEGCWRVTGRVGRTSLTFVVLVGKP